MPTVQDEVAVEGVAVGASSPSKMSQGHYLVKVVKLGPARNLKEMCLLLEECARANPDTCIRPLTHASVDRASQAESVGSSSLVSILIDIRRSPIL
jgi:hypothetical protein